MPFAYAEDGQLAAQGARRFDGFGNVARVARAAGEEHAVRLHNEYGLGGGVPRHHGYVAAAGAQAAHYAQFDAQIDSHHVEAVVGGAVVPALFAGAALHRVAADGRFGEAFQRLFHGRTGIGQQRAAAAAIADEAGEAARVHFADAGDVAVFQHLRQRARIAEVGGLVVVIAHHEAGGQRRAALEVVVGDAVVADHRVGHHHDLKGVGRVGDDLLIADHGGIEHHFAHTFASVAEAPAVKFLAGFQY